MKQFLILTIGVISFFNAFSCGNEYGYSLDGKRIYTRYFYLNDKMTAFDRNSINDKIQKLNMAIESGKANYKTWSNLSLNLMKLGQVDSALKILQPLAKKYPNEYIVVANLGTVYELSSQLDSALKYISLGYKLNKRSHLGSEWIHIEILKAKLKSRKNPEWLNNKSIISLYDLLKRMEKDSISVWTINQNLFYQIRTRVPFTPAPNSVIANLLVTLGDFNREKGTYENSLLAYGYAINFESSENRKSRIVRKIRSLNEARYDKLDIQTLPEYFYKMVKRSKIDPLLLVEGVDELGHNLGYSDSILIEKQDSLEIFRNRLDSIVQHQQSASISSQDDNISLNNWLYLICALFVGAGLMYLAVKTKE